jgi:hypothetical protein
MYHQKHPRADGERAMTGMTLRMQSGGTIPMLPPKDQTPIPDFMRRSQFKDGGEVPGKGKGDKVPALYEPGEFVVSNDMLDDAPSLRGQLHEMREDALTKRGKTVAEADEAAYSGGHETQNRQDDRVQRLDNDRSDPRGNRRNRGVADAPVSLRLAAGGIPGMTVDEIFARSPNSYSPEASAFRNERYGQAGPPRPAAPVTPAAPAAPTRVSQLVGSADDWKNLGTRTSATGEKIAEAARTSLRNSGNLLPGGNAATRFAGAAARKIGPVAGLVEAAYGASQGDTGRTLLGAGDAIASTALATPAAPLAGAYLAGRGAVEAGSAAYDALPQDVQNTIGGTVNNSLRSIPFIGKYLGVDGDRMAQANAEASGPTPGLPGYNPKLTPPDKAQNPGVQAQNPGVQAPSTFGAPDPGARNLRQGNYTVPAGEFGPEDGIVYRNGNSFSGRNISNYGAQNVVQGVSKEVLDRDLTNPDGSRWTAADNAIMAANQRDGVNPYLGTSRQAGMDADAQRKNIERLALSEAGTPGRRAAMKILADREQNAVTLRGQDVTAGTQRATSQAAARTATANAAATKAQQDRTYELDVAKFGQEKAKTMFDQRDQADKSLTSKLESMFTTKDDKGNPIVDKERVAGHKAGVTSYIGDMIDKLRSVPRGSPDYDAAQNKAQELQSRGVSALGEDRLQKLIAQLEVKQRSEAASGGGPFSGSHVDSADPSGYDVVGQDNGLFQDQYRLRNGAKVPTRALDYQRGGNAILPNSWGDNTTNRFDILKKGLRNGG